MMVGWWHCVRRLAAFLVASLASLRLCPPSRPKHLALRWSIRLQVLLNHFCLGGCKLVNHDGCIYELKSFVDTLQVACA
jgi:hypothetical protein